MERDTGAEPSDDMVEAALEAEFGAYHLAVNAPPPVPAFEEAAPQEEAPAAVPSLDDLIEQATSQQPIASPREAPEERASYQPVRDDEWS